MRWPGFLNLFEGTCSFFDKKMTGGYVPLEDGAALFLEDGKTPATLVQRDGVWFLCAEGRAPFPAQGARVCFELDKLPSAPEKAF